MFEECENCGWLGEPYHLSRGLCSDCRYERDQELADESYERARQEELDNG